MENRNSSDATPAYRGYRLQALYTLWRILGEASPDTVFQPEGKEDLAVIDAQGQPIEVIQVKTSNNLTLSDFEPYKSSSFIYRISAELTSWPRLTVTFISFGSVGQELRSALSGNASARTAVAGKIAYHQFISLSNALTVLDHIRLIELTETSVSSDVYNQLGDGLTGIDRSAAFELLRAWLYTCSENKAQIRRIDIIDKINNVGRFLSETSNHHHESLCVYNR